MNTSKMCSLEDMDIWDSEDDEEFCEHYVLTERLRRTLHFGKTSKMDRTPLPMTELAVEYFQEAVPRQLGRVNMYWASSFSRKNSVSPCAMMLGMLYIERLRHKNPHYLEKMSSEDLFLISMMVASKYLYDEGVTEEVYNDEWADSTNLDVEDLNELEIDFLTAMDWRLFVSEESFHSLLANAECCVALKEAGRYGYMTYTDLFVLSQQGKMVVALYQMLAELCKVLALCSVVYFAGVYTLRATPATVTNIHSNLETLPTPDLQTLENLLHTGLSALSPTPLCGAADSCLPAVNRNAEVYDYPNSVSDVKAAVESHISQRRTTRKPSSSSSFLTLELLKETLMMFVVGMNGGGTSNTAPDDERTSTSKTPCNCPHCPGNTRRACSKKNETNLSGKTKTKAQEDLTRTKLSRRAQHPGSWVPAYGSVFSGSWPSGESEAGDRSRDTAAIYPYDRPAKTFNGPCSQVFRKSKAMKHHGIAHSILHPVTV